MAHPFQTDPLESTSETFSLAPSPRRLQIAFTFSGSLQHFADPLEREESSSAQSDRLKPAVADSQRSVDSRRIRSRKIQAGQLFALRTPPVRFKHT
jgi:hypothetical protein